MADGSIFSPRGRAMGRRELEAMGVDTSKYDTEGIAKKTYIITDPDENDLSVIGKGGYGCVVKPVKKCKDDDTNQTIKREEELGKKFVSKIFKERDDGLTKSIVDKNIINNEIANRASLEAMKKYDFVTPDLGMELYNCELETPIQIKECNMKLSNQSLILTELGGMDAEEIYGSKKLELLRNLESITPGEMERAINSNLININELHNLGYVDLDLKLGNILPNFDRPFSFKIIDYDLFHKNNERDVFRYYQANYFFPPEYSSFGKVMFESVSGVSERIFEDWIFDKLKELVRILDKGGYRKVSDKIYSLIYNDEPYVKTDNDLAWGKMIEDNGKALMEISIDVYNRKDKTKFDVEKYIELITSVDYFMYAIALYTFIYELKKTKSSREQVLWDELLEKISRFFHPNYNLRIEAIKEFKRKASI